MHLIVLWSLAAVSVVTGQSTPASNFATTPTATTAAGPSGVNLKSLVIYLLPSASLTSISPAQSTAILANAQSYISDYTQSYPISSLAANIFLAQIGASTAPSPAQQSSLQSMLDNAESNILSDPASFVGAVSSLVAPFGFADAIFSYESGVLDGLRSVVAIQVGVSVPTQATGTSRSSEGGVPTATMGAAAAAAVGALVVGIGLL